MADKEGRFYSGNYGQPAYRDLRNLLPQPSPTRGQLTPRVQMESLPPPWFVIEPAKEINETQMGLPICTWCEFEELPEAIQAELHFKKGRLLMPTYVDLETAEAVLLIHLEQDHPTVRCDNHFFPPYGAIYLKQPDPNPTG